MTHVTPGHLLKRLNQMDWPWKKDFSLKNIVDNCYGYVIMYMSLDYHYILRLETMHRTTIMLPEDLKLQAVEYARECGLSLGEVIRESLENWLKNKSQRSASDPLFHNVPVYDGPVPEDYSINHDKYLYGE